MRRSTALAVFMGIAQALFAGIPAARAQEGVALAAGRGPRFLVATTQSSQPPVPVDAARVPVLTRRVSLQLENVGRTEALDAISRASGLRLVYASGVTLRQGRVRLKAEEITVAAALTEALLDSGVDVLLTPSGNAVLVKRVEEPVRVAGTISGQVTDVKSGQGLVGAEVLLEGTAARVLTGEDGRYRLVEVAPGTYTLLARRPGYGPARRPVTVTDGQELTIDVALEPRPTQLDEVVVTGTLVPTEVKALPSPVSVITAEQIEQQHIRTYGQLLRQLVPGLIAWEEGTRPEVNVMSVRGTSSMISSELKVYVDGVQLGENLQSQLDPQSIERIEVIRGPQAAALYGSDAIGGVIEIFTKRGDPSLQRLQGSAHAAVGGIQSPYRDGAALRQKYGAELRGASGKASFNLGGGYSRDGEWIERYSAALPSAYGGMRFEQGPFSLDLTARYYGQNYSVPFNSILKTTGYVAFQTPSYTRVLGRQEAYGVQLRYKLTPSWQHQLIVGMDRYSSISETYRPRLRTPTDTLLAVGETYYNRLSVAYRSALTAQLSPALNAVVSAGVDYNLFRGASFSFPSIYNLIGTIQAAPTSRPWAFRDRTTNAGYFAQAQLGFRDALFLTGSVRLDENSNFGDDIGTPVSPRVGLSYVQALGGATLKLRSAYGEAIKAPGFDQKAGSRSSFGIVEPNPMLRPERQVGPEFGADLVFGSRGSLGVTYYRQTARDLIAATYREPFGGLTVVRYENVGRVRNEGLEVEGRVDLAGVQLTGQYAYTSSKLLDPGPDYGGDERVGEQISSVPQHTAGATLTVTPVRRLGVTTGVAYVGARHGIEWVQVYRCFGGTGECGDYFETGDLRTFWARFPGFAKFNLAVDYELRSGLTPYIAVENVANSNPTERAPDGTLPGRITTVGLRIRY